MECKSRSNNGNRKCFWRTLGNSVYNYYMKLPLQVEKKKGKRSSEKKILKTLKNFKFK